MIGKLVGVVDSVRDNVLILDVGGVGYLVHAPRRILQQSVPGQTMRLWIETRMRENSLTLFGFSEHPQHMAFCGLCKIAGVGAKLALAILSHLSVEELSFAAHADDCNVLCGTPGVGSKLARRILNELQETLKKKTGWLTASMALTSSDKSSSDTALPEVISDAMEALIGLGYRTSDVRAAISSIQAQSHDRDLHAAALVRLALRRLSA